MEPYFSADGVTLHLGDCIDVIATMPDASVDAIVTDPPYGLTELPADVVTKAIAAWMAGDRTHVPSGRGGFMGRAWDRFVPPPGVWDECLRVLKPGGHLVAFAGARTADLMGLSIRLAGFEIRDSLHWIYGSGFPKSLDVSKAIDKAAGAKRDVVGLHPRPAGNKPGGASLAMSVKGMPDAATITAPATPDAARWSGFGTGLKPAHEPIILARRPLTGTVAATVLEHGTGALNIDATRVGKEVRTNNAGGMSSLQRVSRVEQGYRQTVTQSVGEVSTVTGRWPANVILAHPPLLDEHGEPVGDACADGCADGCAVAEMDAQSGITGSNASANKGRGMGYRGADGARGAWPGGDSGGASRFFPVFRYQAKAPSSERPRLEDGTAHPTVKPLALMSWLVRLVTPPGGTVLEPFAGSGTTLAAAVREDMHVIGIEQHEPYARLCVQRLEGPRSVALFPESA